MNNYYLTDKNQIQTFLNTDRAYHAYALADLDDPYFKHCQWLGAGNGTKIDTMILVFQALSPPALLTMGQNNHLNQLLNQSDLPAQVMFIAKEDHLPTVLDYYQAHYVDPMLRMVLPSNNFKPIKAYDVIRLDQNHLTALETLYQEAHGNAFAPYQLEQGFFYGILVNGSLVAAAGTHIVSPQYQIAAFGNVYTHPHYRGQGFAQRLSSVVCQELLAQNLHVVLNVETNNPSAIHIYKKLGFIEYCPFWEGVGDKTVNSE